jgi:hypothetical protein
VLSSLQVWACGVLHEYPKGATYEETIRETDDWSGDQKLAIGFLNQISWTQDDGQSPQEFASDIEQMTLHAFPAQYEDHIHGGSGKALGNGTRYWAIKQQLCLRNKRILSETQRKLEVVTLAVRSSIRLQKANRRLWRGHPSPKRKKKWRYTCGLQGMSSLKEGAMWHDSWKTWIVEPEETAIARERQINTFLWQW